MLSAKSFYQSYCSTVNNKPDFFRKTNPNHRWVQITLDIKDMRKLLRDADFEERFVLSKAITAAERKRDWHYKQPDFDLATASFIIRQLERATA